MKESLNKNSKYAQIQNILRGGGGMGARIFKFAGGGGSEAYFL